MEKIVLIGKPNCGKSTLFNQLTGLNQKTGNFSGVTVQQKKGKFENHEIVDLPGLQSLQSQGLDEQVSVQEVLKLSQINRIIFIANGMQLEESLILFSQIADLQIPMLLVVNFQDEFEKNGQKIAALSLTKQLGCETILLSALNGNGLADLKKAIRNDNFLFPNAICRSDFDNFSEKGEHNNTYKSAIANEKKPSFWENDLLKRREKVQAIIKESVKTTVSNYLTKTQKFDKILLHPVKGLVIYLLVMFLVFQAVFSLTEYPMGLIDDAFSGLADLFSNKFIKAIILGLGAIFVFIPPIAFLFFLIGLLEHTGYLSRISFIADAFLRKFGLSGHSAIPLMSSWACAIPAIMSARIITNPKERFAVIMATPFMTCSARLPVYAVLIIMLFPAGTAFWGAKGLILLSLYLLGVIATLVVAWLINKNSKIPSSDNWLLELPVFRKPNWKNIFITVFQKTKMFVLEAGKIILIISVLLFVLAEFSPKNEEFISQKVEESQKLFPNEDIESLQANIELEYSYLGYLGKGIEPVVKPLGYDWKIGIALLSSFAAREVFSSTLVTIYSINEADDEDENNERIADKLRNDLIKQGKEGQIFAISISLLLFYVFALQCMSTLAIVQKETNSWKYAMLQFTFMLVVAYAFAFIGYTLLK